MLGQPATGGARVTFRMVDLIPRSVLFGNPERTSPQLSPDGTRLTWIAPLDGVLNVWVAPVSAAGGGARRRRRGLGFRAGAHA